MLANKLKAKHVEYGSLNLLSFIQNINVYYWIYTNCGNLVCTDIYYERCL